MEIIIGLVITSALTVSSLSFVVIRYAAHRPANGELKTLANLERKILLNQQCIARNLSANVRLYP